MHRAAGVADVPVPVVARSVAEVDVGAVDVSPGLGLVAEAGLWRRCPEVFSLNVHFHVLVHDGAFDDDGVFVAVDPPADDDVRRIMVRAARRVISKLNRFFDDDDERRREIDRP